MTDRRLSQLQLEYRSFFLEKLRYYDVNSPAELTSERKSEFFSGIKQDWAKIKREKNHAKTPPSDKIVVNSDYQTPVLITKRTAGSEENFNRTQSENLFQHTREVIRSLPNPEQTDNLKVHYTPNAYFEQGPDYHYPVVKM